MPLVRVKKVDKPEKKYSVNNIIFYCAACKIRHTVDKRFKLDMDGELPTITPQCRFRYTDVNGAEIVCNVGVERGKLLYAADCTHNMAGKTIVMKDVDYSPTLKGHFLGEDSFKREGGVRYAQPLQ
jgi:hypothetical protein